MLFRLAMLLAAGVLLVESEAVFAASVTGEIVDAENGQILPARIYIRGADGRWYFPKSASPGGSASYLKKGNGKTADTAEQFTTLSAHPFSVQLPAGKFFVTVERGKEYIPLVREVVVGGEAEHWRLPLTRWINMEALGWYSGDTHCHQHFSEVGNVMMAEDLNVCLPLGYWTTELGTTAKDSSKNAKGPLPSGIVEVDGTHAWSARNTEYEIFTVGGKRHALGAFLIIDHQSAFDLEALPLRDIAAKARSEGALLDLEKHNWEWAFIVAPVLPIDLFELSNNHNWRIPFGVRGWGVPSASWMDIASIPAIDNEPDWINYGWETYYGLLNSGLNIQPTAGTGYGVHPVPMGHSRVYVNLPDGFSYQAWMAGLKAGRSFVTTGPMMLLRVNGNEPGGTFTEVKEVHVDGELLSRRPLDRVELVVNGDVIALPINSSPRTGGGYVTRVDRRVVLDRSSWVAVRCFEKRTGGSQSFAHSAPWRFMLNGKSVRPKQRELAYFTRRVEEEIERNRAVLSEKQLEEFHQALAFWTKKEESRVEDGFESIFDGTLKGWRCVPAERSGDWSAKDGVLSVRGDAAESYLVWDDSSLADFEMKFSYRIRGEGNTGVQIRSFEDKGGSHYLKGYHADLGHVGIGPKVLGAWDWHGGGRGDYLVKRGEKVLLTAAGATTSHLPESLEVGDVRKGRWNDVHIVVQGQKMFFTINGITASAVEDRDSRHRLESGLVGLQAEGGDGIEFTELRIRRLKKERL